jgi:hypothetical protein
MPDRKNSINKLNCPMSAHGDMPHNDLQNGLIDTDYDGINTYKFLFD